MSKFKAQSLAEVSRAISPGPLEPGDPRYADLSAARGTEELRMLQLYLEDCAQEGCCACAAFIGHRGGGKTTELKRLEGKLATSFTSLHIEIDDSLKHDCDYTDLFLWTVDEIVRIFQEKGLPLDGKKVKAVANWFAEHSITEESELKAEIELATEAEAKSRVGANLGFFAYSATLLARLKSRLVGSQTYRDSARRKLQAWSAELLARVNELLAHAREVLAAADQPRRLLIVQDNLDRLLLEPALRLFRDNGDILTQLDADCIWTAPINAHLAPFRSQALFDQVCPMPMVKVHYKAGQPFRPGIDGLVDLVGKRIDLDLVFAAREVIEHLAQYSGGSVRDLLQLVSMARLSAQAHQSTVIEMDDARVAVKKLRISFEQIFSDTDYRLLAAVALHKRNAGDTPETAESNKTLFAALLVNGSVLEYNGEGYWCDVHPVIRDIEAFQDAYKEIAPAKKGRSPRLD